MKKSALLLAFTLFFIFKTSAQSHHHEKAALNKEIELLLDSAAKYMVNFIVTKIESDYHHAIRIVNMADSIDFILMTKFTNHKDSTAALNVEMMKERNEEFRSYRNSWLKQEIEGESKDCKKKNKVLYKGKEIFLCDKAKLRFDEFIQYLPAN